MPDLSHMRVLIAEDQALVRQGILALLSSTFDHIIEVEDGMKALDEIKSGGVDIALLDIGLPHRTGLDILGEVRARKYDVKIIIITGDTDTYSPASIYEKGADAFIYKTTDADHFIETVISVSTGKSVTAPETNSGQNVAAIAHLKEQLTSRELQIVKLVVEGQTNKTIAKTLFISEHTVRKHREHINKKLAISSPMALAAFAIKAGLIC